MNIDSETFTPLVCSVIDKALLKTIPANMSVRLRCEFFEIYPLLNFYANFTVYRVYVWVLE